MCAASNATSTPWYVYAAESRDGGATFTQSQATGVIHRGELCTHGSGCADENSRNLLDDFGVAISPTTGLTSITYTSDQPDGTAGHAFTGYTTMLPTAAKPREPPPAPARAPTPLAATGGCRSPELPRSSSPSRWSSDAVAGWAKPRGPA